MRRAAKRDEASIGMAQPVLLRREQWREGLLSAGTRSQLSQDWDLVRMTLVIPTTMSRARRARRACFQVDDQRVEAVTSTRLVDLAGERAPSILLEQAARALVRGLRVQAGRGGRASHGRLSLAGRGRSRPQNSRRVVYSHLFERESVEEAFFWRASNCTIDQGYAERGAWASPVLIERNLGRNERAREDWCAAMTSGGPTRAICGSGCVSTRPGFGRR